MAKKKAARTKAGKPAATGEQKRAKEAAKLERQLADAREVRTAADVLIAALEDRLRELPTPVSAPAAAAGDAPKAAATPAPARRSPARPRGAGTVTTRRQGTEGPPPSGRRARLKPPATGG
jgi:hypothetical protein